MLLWLLWVPVVLTSTIWNHTLVLSSTLWKYTVVLTSTIWKYTVGISYRTLINISSVLAFRNLKSTVPLVSALLELSFCYLS